MWLVDLFWRGLFSKGIRKAQADRVGVAVDFEFIIHEHKADEGHHRDTAAGIVASEAGSSASADFVEGGCHLEGSVHVFDYFSNVACGFVMASA